MNQKPQLLLLAAVLSTFVCVSTSAVWACGKERWDVKVAKDKDKDRVDEAPVPVSIDTLRKIASPVNPNIRPNVRYAPTELTVYEITGTIVFVKKESDEDYHLVIQDTNGRTMIIESPAPDCATGSRFEDNIKKVRNDIDSEFGSITGTAKKPKKVATVTGIGFFDPIHGQTGVAPNGIELHPIMTIDFHPDKTVSGLKTRLRSKKDEGDD